MSILNAPKRILYIENGIGYGGAIICLRHLVRNLDRSKYTPLVVTGRNGPHYREIAEEAQWRHIPDRHIDIVGAHRKIDPLKWPDKIPGLRFIINQILARTDDIANFLPFFIRLLYTAKKFKADLIHANNEPLCNRAALMVGKVLNIPVVCHVRGNQDGSRLMQWAYSLPDRLISVSHWVARNIQEKLAIPADTIDVIYDGIELEKLDINADGNAFRSRHNIAENDFAVGLIGLLIPWKGQEIFLDAAKILKPKIPHLKMLIVGGTPDECKSYEALLRQRVIGERLEDTVIFTGHIAKMEPVYNGLDVVVSASTSPEPLGTVVIEALAMGRPLIGPHHGGAAEMMQHDKTGLLFTPKDAASLAEQIEKYYNNAQLRNTLGNNARQHALRTFAVSTHAEKIQTVYESLL
ncbi:MAG: glycosyltransferase family 1 protein [Gammaproteobacteria bacterium HGW-Gammaproteobacteria-3]|nr:MAG: glycosyltransferase family 1 protein [Gammaproteobacteria bacterium HGW-Gammaproteobacteria-3]